MLQVILKGLECRLLLTFILFKLPKFVSKISMGALCKFFYQIDQKLKSIGIYSFEFNSQYLLFSVDKLLIDKLHLSPS